MGGSIVSNALVVAPVSQRIARAFPNRSLLFANAAMVGGNTA
jgi:hypothetical protein